MSTLWERAAKEPTPVAVEAELTVNAIEKAVQEQSSEWKSIKDAALANLAERPGAMSPRPGSSPMAPRLTKPLPAIPAFVEKPVQTPKKRRSARRKKIVKSESPEASGVA
jgi:hypothetical protein